MTAQIIVMSLVQTEIDFAVSVCAVVVYFVRRVYLWTSRQLRALDLEAKASLYSGFHQTIDGLPTICAFGWQAAVERRNIDAIDLSTRPVFFMHCLNRWQDRDAVAVLKDGQVTVETDLSKLANVGNGHDQNDSSY
ncbi:hypothetical protein MY11210_004505 [Beauveria gryllotalpidicola]